MTTDAGWLSVDVTAPATVKELGAALDRSPLAAQATLFNDPRWIGVLASQNDKFARVYALREHGQLAGLAVFLVHPSAVPIALGELTLLSRPVQRLDALAAPIAMGDGNRRRETSNLTGLLDRLRQDLGRNEVVFLESVVEGSAMFDLLTGPLPRGAGLHAIQNGKLYRHRFAAIPGSFEAYLKQLGSRTRADLRTNRKRFIAHVQQTHRTRCFRSCADVPEFVATATELSRKTYQYRLLGSGLRESQALERCYLATAELGWFRSYVLYANDRPIAFQVGHVYRGRFHAQEIGYDPAWAPHHVGIFLHTEIVTDLAASNGVVHEFDFGNGDLLHKERLSTGSRLEGYFYLIPASLRGSVLAAAMRVAHRVSSALGGALDHFGVRKQTRDLLRKLGVMK